MFSSSLANDISSRFNEQKLVYDSRRKTWQSARDCIWAKESIKIPGKFSIQDQYGSLNSFFTAVLRVDTPSLELHIEGLKKTASSQSIDDIKQRIRNICQFMPKPSDLVSLSDCRCFPVNRADGTLAWMTCNDDFALNDRREYAELLGNHIDILGFTLEDVHNFRPFLIGLGLGDRHLSKLVMLNTSSEGGEISESLTADLNRKAYAICR
jgi:hypothetical protein